MRHLRVHIISVAAIVFFFTNDGILAADKLRLAYVSPSVTLSLPWVAKETGILAKYDLAAEVVLITGRDWSSHSSLVTSMWFLPVSPH